MTLSPQTLQQIDYLARDLSQLFTPPELIVGCEVMSIADIDEYDTNNGWIEAVVGRHNQQRCRWKGQFDVQVGDYIDVLYFASYRLFVVMGQGGDGAITPPGGVWPLAAGLVRTSDGTTYATIALLVAGLGAGVQGIIGVGSYTSDGVTFAANCFMLGSGIDISILTTSANGKVLQASGKTLTLEEFTLSNTYTSGNCYGFYGTTSSVITARKMRFAALGATTFNAGFYLADSTAYLHSCLFYAANGSSINRAMMLDNCNAEIYDGVFTGDVYLTASATKTITLKNPLITGNVTIDYSDLTVNIEGGRITGNLTITAGTVNLSGDPKITGTISGTFKGSYINSSNQLVIRGATGGPQSGVANIAIAKLGHILDGGHPANSYPTNRNANDAEFNNSTQAENNSIGTHAGGDFWEWSPGAPTASNINTYPSMLFIQKNASDSGTDRYLKGNITALGADDAGRYECFIKSLPKTNKTGNIFSMKLIDTSSGNFCRIKVDDHATNGIQIVGTYEAGGGETTQASIIIGHPIGPCVIGLARAESGGNAFVYWYFQSGTTVLTANDYFTNRSLVAKANFTPNQIRLEVSNVSQLVVFVDSFRRTL